MKLNEINLKPIAKILTALLIVGGATWFYAETLQLLVPTADEQLAQVLVVPTRHSLVDGESLVPVYEAPPLLEVPLPDAAPVAPSPAAAEEGVNLVVTARAAVSDESGASASLTAKEAPCPEGATPGNEGLKVLQTLTAAPALRATLSRQVCLRAQADSLRGQGPAREASWHTSASVLLPDLESRVATLGYLDPAGLPRTLNLSVVGYCATEEGDCSATLALEKTYPATPVRLPLHLGGDGSIELVLDTEN